MSLSNNNDLSGWLEQQGDKALLKTWRRRWFAQKGDYLYYFKSPEDKQPINYISLQRLEAPVKLAANSNTRFELRVRSHAADDVNSVAMTTPSTTPLTNSATTTLATAAALTSSAPTSSSSSLTSTSTAASAAQSEFVLLRLRASTPEEAQFWLAGLNDLLRQQAVAAKNAILSAHSAPIVAVKRDAVATRLTHAVVQSIGAPIAPEVVAAIERELSVSLAERDTEVASARSESQLLLSELTDARRVIARLAESLGPAKAQQILAEASPSSSSAGHSHQPMPLTSDTLRRHNKDKPATLARGKPTVLSRRYDPLRVYDRSYVVALEKELLDTREELDDLKTAIDETEATINTLKTKFPHLQSANINLGSKSKAPDDAALDAELPPGTADDDDAASATLEAFVVWRATMAQDQLHHAAALQRPMPPIDSFAAADSSAPEFAAMPVAAAIEHDSDSDEQPPPPQEGDASMRFVPLSQMSRPVPSSPTAATAAAAPFDLVAPAKPKRSVNPPPSALAPGAPEVGSPSSPRPTPPPRAAQPTPAVPPKSPPVSPRVPRSSKPLPQLPPKSRTSTTQHPNAPAPVDEDKTPSERHETSEDGDSVRVSQRQAKPLPGLSSPDLELARQAARKPLPVAGHTVATPTSPPLPATAIATAAAALPVAKKPPMPTVARPALRVNVAAAGGVAQGPASPGSPTKRAPPTLTLPALPGFPQGQPSAYDLVPTASEMEAALVDEAAAAAAAVEVPAALTDYGKIPTFVDETQTEETVEAESEH